MPEQASKPLRLCTPAELMSAGFAGRMSLGKRKYSLGLLEEALKLSDEIGLTKASKMTGVNIRAIMTYRQVKRGPVAKARHQKTTHEQKKECLNLAAKLHHQGFSRSRTKCWAEAGRLLGINGRTVQKQYTSGVWKA